MAEPVYKILYFMKRRPGMSVADFRDYYENHHSKFVQKYMTPAVKRYVRRYIDAQPNPETGDSSELAYDVITELWFEDEAIFRTMVKYLSTSIMPDDVIADEKNLFDRPKIRIATVTESE
jgi:hypothetical protein